jgi:hypothetical protein
MVPFLTKAAPYYNSHWRCHNQQEIDNLPLTGMSEAIYNSQMHYFQDNPFHFQQ